MRSGLSHRGRHFGVFLVVVSFLVSGHAQARSVNAETNVVPNATRKTTTTTIKPSRTTTTTTIPWTTWPVPPAPEIDPNNTYMSYKETGKFTVTITNDANPTASDPTRYMKISVYKYLVNSSDVGVSVCGSNKWKGIQQGIPSSNWRRVGPTSLELKFDVSSLKLGQKFLISISQLKMTDEISRRRASEFSTPFCYENTVQPGLDVEYRNCIKNGSVVSFVKFTFAAANASKILKLPELTKLRQADPVTASKVINQLDQATRAKSKTVVMSMLKKTTTGAKVAYDVRVASSTGEVALTFLSLIATAVFVENPLVALVVATANLIFNLRDNQANCELIYKG
jgi:hypothetical protein